MVQLQTLSKNQQVVLEIIVKAKEPLKAYSILYNVKYQYCSLFHHTTHEWDVLFKVFESKQPFVAIEGKKRLNQELFSTIWYFFFFCQNILI